MQLDAIILARKNSKRLKNKNFKLLNRKELIDYTIESAIKSKKISQIYCFSDKDLSYKKKKYKRKVNFIKRPFKISKDNTTTEETIRFLLKILNKKKKFSKNFILLQASSPLRTSSIIDKSIEIFFKKKNKSFASFREITKNTYIKVRNKFILQKKFFFQRDGSIFIFNSKEFLKTNKIISESSGGIILKKELSIDIDTIKDFHEVQKKLKNKKKKK